MIPFRASSSVEDNFSRPFSGICIDLSYMDQIVEFHPDGMDVVVQPGVNWMDLNKDKRLLEVVLFMPMDPSPTTTIGGTVSTNCSGTNAMRYSTMKD
jgi:D-lactate dehydrogenase (cytochrome)